MSNFLLFYRLKSLWCMYLLAKLNRTWNPDSSLQQPRSPAPSRKPNLMNVAELSKKPALHFGKRHRGNVCIRAVFPGSRTRLCQVLRSSPIG
jgi:hypothetical protein